MNWLSHLCSCINPSLNIKGKLFDYLNSTQLNAQVIEEEKCTEQDHEPQADPHDHIYARAKAQSYNFMKVEQHSDDEDDTREAQGRNGAQRDPEEEGVIDVFWYPRKGPEGWDRVRLAMQHKARLLAGVLAGAPSEGNYDKVYDSQDELGLLIYCKLESLLRGKKINSYRFNFNVAEQSLPQYQQWVRQVDPEDVLPLLSSSQQLGVDPEDSAVCLSHMLFKKLLVINPHQTTLAHRVYTAEDEEVGKQVYLLAFSVEHTIMGDQQLQQKQGYNSGWLHLCGVKVHQGQAGLHFEGYMNVELDVSVSPNMLKQPIAKEIRVLVQRLVCSLNKTDQI